MEERWSFRRDRYGVLLLLLSAALLLIPIDWPPLRPVIAALLGLVLLFAQHTSGAGRRVVTVSAALVVIAVVAAAVALAGDVKTAEAVYSAVLVILSVSAIVTIGNHLVRDPGLDVHIILGVISVFMLLGIAFAAGYGLMGAWHGQFFAQEADPSAADYFYFSFITITTTGYGDLTPAGDAARMVAAFEALIGQVYLVTVVALAVSGVTTHRRRG